MQGFYTEFVNWDNEYSLDSFITLCVRHGDSVFYILYEPPLLASSPQLLEQYRQAYDILPQDDHEEFIKLANSLRAPFERLMTQMAGPPKSPQYLHQYLYPPQFIFEARVGEDKSQLQPSFKQVRFREYMQIPGEPVSRASLEPHLSPLLRTTIPRFSSDQVQVLTQTEETWVPSRVLVAGQQYFFRPWDYQGFKQNRYHELQAYAQIYADGQSDTPLLTSAHICRLHGIVIDRDEDTLQHYSLEGDEPMMLETRLVGLLLTYIERCGTLVSQAPFSNRSVEDRLRWSAQMETSVQLLHQTGVVWGGVKPQNVLVDVNGDACIVDFGRTKYTEGWVDEDKKGTVEGDLQGVQKIRDWVNKWSLNPLPPRDHRHPDANGSSIS
ncbi:hypothetical protein N7456_002564 [Penicillium angulare]|uniref:Protein kinase domain-containing protein n=1 Tax=Penicillium angulare TaxID=116970 RepID=A0A9W9KPZ9_9EURO|nr:hypothetical protein N7456_002564 [Penicillium angulare]